MKSNYFLVLIACFILSCNNTNSKSQNVEIATKENLYFSKEDPTKVALSDSSYISNFTLNKDAFLNIHFVLDKPLVKILKDLAPNLKEDALLEKGNFQFSFFVDDTLIYVENLNKGSGLKASKTEQLNHTVRMISPTQLDYWGWFMWLKFMKLGNGQDALSEGNHALRIEVRAYLKEDSLELSPILAKGSLAVAVEELPVDKSLIPVQKIQENSGWEVSKDSYDQKKIEALNKRIASNRFEDINGIVVIKEGKLLLEEYFNGETRESLHDPRSVGKTIASSIMGIAIEERYIESENTLLKEFYNLKSFANYSEKKAAVTLKSLLTMSSGFVGDDNDYNSLGNEENMYPTKNWVKFALDLPMEKEKVMEQDFSYFTAGVVVLGDVLHKSVPKGLVSYADKKLFAPLGITNYRWEYTPQKVGNTAGGIRLSALDFAKYGQLYKNKGRWKGKQIISEDWVEKSLGKQVRRIPKGHYGYLFWNDIYTVNNRGYEVAYCSGMGGNKIFIFKDLPYVVVITSSAYNSPNMHANVDKMMTEYILPAVLTK